MKKERDYNRFTKAELADFLNKHGDDFKYSINPYNAILEARAKDVMDQINMVLTQNRKLIEKFGDDSIPMQEKVEINQKIHENYKITDSLRKKSDKLYRELWEG